jgi:hypothetical protein
MELTVSPETRSIAGILLLTVPAVQSGGAYPNRLVWLLYVGAASLAAGAVALGASLLLG